MRTSAVRQDPGDRRLRPEVVAANAGRDRDCGRRAQEVGQWRVLPLPDGGLAADLPYVILGGASPAQRRLARTFLQFLLTVDQQYRLESAGMRRCSCPAILPSNREVLAERLRRQWPALRRPVSTVVLLDVSTAGEEHREAVPSGLRDGLSRLTDSDRFGLWTTANAGRDPYRRAVPLGPPGPLLDQFD